MGPTSVRRNLFHHHLGRRPVSTVPSSASGQSSGSAANNGVSGYSSHMSAASTESTSSLSSGPVDNGEIVARGKNGDYKLDIPILPPITGVDDGDEMEGVEDGGVPRGSGAGGVDSTGQTGMGGSGKEKIEASLVEMICRNRNRQMNSEPAEILNLVHQSLRNKVAVLDEDNWMYEPESEAGL